MARAATAAPGMSLKSHLKFSSQSLLNALARREREREREQAKERRGAGEEEEELWQNTLQKMHPIYENSRVM